ncbi:alpha/beta fold hydrolase [Qipengyuania sp. DGS5-3]|uniref:alpha/beta fold hydrolase n=1 Tax=Qipengyuania sp. DGS5-3 TaxID=3349632 RepID=UPI0036D42105
MLLSRMAARLETRNWKERIQWARTGPPSQSCSDIDFYEDDVCLIRYRKAGRGPAIVFLCDGPATLEVYDALFAALKAQFTVIAFEAPGNGFSVPKPGYDFGFRPVNDGVARFLRSVAGGPAILAFSCGGTYAAIDVASRHPELCSHLIAIQVPSWSEEMLWKKRRDPKGIVSTPFLGQILFPRMMKPRAPAWYEHSMADTPAVAHFCTCTAQAFGQGATFALPTMFQNYLSASEAPFEPPLQPTLAIWGEQDQSHAETDKSSSLSLAKNCELVRLEHVGHFPELEDPVGFSRLLVPFTKL